MEENVMSYLDPERVDQIPPGVLAYIGDAVYELYVREKLLKNKLNGGRCDVDLDELHKEAVLRVVPQPRPRPLPIWRRSSCPMRRMWQGALATFG